MLRKVLSTISLLASALSILVFAWGREKIFQVTHAGRCEVVWSVGVPVAQSV